MKAWRLGGAALAWGVAVLGGCGGSDALPSDDRSGEGSGTLEVVVRISATPTDGESAATADGLHTTFEVDVRDATGTDVEDALVVVESDRGAATLVEGGCDRRYCGSQSGYARAYAVSVARGSDFLDGVVIHGAGFHTVTAPAPGATVDAAMPLDVMWSPSGDADSVRLRTRDFEAELVGDPGAFEVPADNLRTDDEEPEDERVRVRRERQLALTGGLGGSNAQVAVRNGVAFFTMPTP